MRRIIKYLLIILLGFQFSGCERHRLDMKLQIPDTNQIDKIYPVNYNDIPQPLYSPLSMFYEEGFYSRSSNPRYWAYNKVFSPPYIIINNSIPLEISKRYNIKKIQFKYSFGDYKGELKERYVSFHQNGMWDRIYIPDYPIDIKYFDTGLIQKFTSTESFFPLKPNVKLVDYIYTSNDTTYIKDEKRYDDYTFVYVKGRFNYYDRNDGFPISSQHYTPRYRSKKPRKNVYGGDGALKKNQIFVNTKYFNRDSCDLLKTNYVLINENEEIIQYELKIDNYFYGESSDGNYNIVNYKTDTIDGVASWEYHAYRTSLKSYSKEDEILYRKSVINKRLTNGRVSLDRNYKGVQELKEGNRIGEYINFREKWEWVDDITMEQKFSTPKDNSQLGTVWTNILTFQDGHLLKIISKDSTGETLEEYDYSYDKDGFVSKLVMKIIVLDTLDFRNSYNPRRNNFSPRNGILNDKIFQSTPECPKWPIAPVGSHKNEKLFSGLNENQRVLEVFLGSKSRLKISAAIDYKPENDIYKNKLVRFDRAGSPLEPFLSKRISIGRLQLLQNINGWLEYESDYPFFDVYDVNPIHIKGDRQKKNDLSLLNYSFDKNSTNNNGTIVIIEIEQHQEEGKYIFDFTRKIPGYTEITQISYTDKGMPIKRVKHVNDIKLVETNFETQENRIMKFTSFGLLPNLSHLWYKTDGFPNSMQSVILFDWGYLSHQPDNKSSYNSSGNNMSLSFNKPIVESGCSIDAKNGLINRVEVNLIDEEHGIPLYYSPRDCRFDMRKRPKSVPKHTVIPEKRYRHINTFYPLDHVVEYEITKY